MPKRSAGILLWRRERGMLYVLLVHPGGPFWRKRDMGSWSIPKGECLEGEAPLAVARRELAEELGPAAAAILSDQADDTFVPLGEIKQRGGKIVTAFALAADFDVAQLSSNHFEIEWPPNSGRRQSFPEVDQAEWFSLPRAADQILPSQLDFLQRLQARLGER